MPKLSRNEDRLVLVTGATGKQGSAALRHLRHRRFRVRALTRDPEKPAARALTDQGVEVMGGDLSDENACKRAVDGAYGVLSVQDSRQGAEKEIQQGKNLADAAKRQAVDHFVYNSVASADQNTGIPHFDSKYQIEEHVKQTGLAYTILRPVFFMENWLAMREQILNGTIALPLRPELRLQMIAADNIGGFVAAALEHPGKFHNKTLEIATDELSMQQIAQAFSRITTREVDYQQMPWDEFDKKVPHDYTLMYRWFEETGYHADIAALRSEYPDLTWTFEHWLHSTWQTVQPERA